MVVTVRKKKGVIKRDSLSTRKMIAVKKKKKTLKINHGDQRLFVTPFWSFHRCACVEFSVAGVSKRQKNNKRKQNKEAANEQTNKRNWNHFFLTA